MKITEHNIDKLPAKDVDLVNALLTDIEEINNWQHVGGHSSEKDIYLDWQDFHNEYSPERTDPCPDYYGYYALMQLGEDGYETICDKMPIKDIDWLVCGILDHTQNLYKNHSGWQWITEDVDYWVDDYSQQTIVLCPYSNRILTQETCHVGWSTMAKSGIYKYMIISKE